MRSVQMESIRAVDRAVDVLNAFTHQTPTLTIDEVCSACSLPKATVYRILYTLERRGLVRFDQKSLKYRLGFRLLAYANVVSSSLDLRQEADEILLNLYDQTRQTVHMAIHEADTMVYVFSKENPEGLKVSAFEGPRRPLLFGAFGYVLAAYMSTVELEHLFENSIPRFTAKTVVDRDVILKRLADIREEQIWVDTDEAILGVTGVAAPVFDMNGNCVAAVGINGPTVQLTGDQLMATKNFVREAARAISLNLGFEQGLEFRSQHA